jgi:predicted glutamine amidotransferase
LCGLVGAFRTADTTWDKQMQPFMLQGLLVSMLRGYQGTGVGLADDKTFEVTRHVSACSAVHFLGEPEYERMEDDFKSSCVIMGHTRSPTIANTIAKKNCQPFAYYKMGDPEDEYMLTHNGHINNYSSLTPTTFNHAVDSAHVCYAMAAEGPEVVLPKLNGSYVLIWFNIKKRTVNIVKNEARSLYTAMSKDGEAMYYASEAPFLRMLLDRNSFPYKEILEVKPHVWFEWDLTKKTLHAKEREMEEKTKPYSAAAAVSHTSYKGPSQIKRPFKGDWFRVNAETSTFEYYPKSQTHGFVHGKRKYAEGYGDSIVKIVGIDHYEWDAKWKYLADHLAVTLHTVEDRKDEHGGEYIYFEGILRTLEMDKDWSLYNGPGKHKLTVVGTKALPDMSRAEAVLVLGPHGTLIPLKDWTEYTKDGCYMCDSAVTEEQAGKVKWYKWERNPEDAPEDVFYQPICENCCRDQNALNEVGAI